MSSNCSQENQLSEGLLEMDMAPRERKQYVVCLINIASQGKHFADQSFPLHLLGRYVHRARRSTLFREALQMLSCKSELGQLLSAKPTLVQWP